MGEGIARLFASEGASVVVSDRNEALPQASERKAAGPFSSGRMSARKPTVARS